MIQDEQKSFLKCLKLVEAQGSLQSVQSAVCSRISKVLKPESDIIFLSIFIRNTQNVPF